MFNYGIGKKGMNQNKTMMLNELQWLKQNGCVGIKSEFEAEGIRDEELIWLSQLVRYVNLPLTVKIGGCEAIRDMHTINSFGVEKIVAPMIESVYALEKYSQSLRKVFQEKSTVNLFNIETITGYDNIQEIVEYAEQDEWIDGIVFGRVDFSRSKGLPVNTINTNVVTSSVQSAALLCKCSDLQFLVGGNVNKSAATTLKQIKNVHLSAFETRKVIFDADVAEHDNYSEIIEHAVNFELAWLKYKQRL